MEEEQKTVEQSTRKRRKRRKTENQLKLETLKEILKHGLDSHKKAIDEVISSYNEYVKYDELVKERDELNARILAVEALKAGEAK